MQDDNQFITTFLGIMGVLVVIFFVIFVIAQVVVPDKLYSDRVHNNSVVERIEPVGKLNYGKVSLSPSTTSKDTSAPLFSNGEEVYKAVCQSCHTTGVINAPLYGNKDSWGERINKDLSVLYQNAINGIGAMPAKGGRPDISNKLVKSAVDYIVNSLK
ncbi:MAG: cytochrome C [Gammaproteobacteria bacterium]|nr:cytochrome C [Gammaproteobacteria bacterium]|tara:strand:- start:3329 stop:3802 length:474 start_codon:yes stop_codon:yes gene_type:complete